MDLDDFLVRAVAPAHLAETIIGDLYERRAELARRHGSAKARIMSLAETLRSLPSLLIHCIVRSLEDNWATALLAATIVCALCIATIPLWNRMGVAEGPYHVLRLVIIGFALGTIPRASALSCVMLLFLIGVTNSVIDARDLGIGWHVFGYAHLYAALSIDAAAMAFALVALRLTRRFV